TATLPFDRARRPSWCSSPDRRTPRVRARAGIDESDWRGRAMSEAGWQAFLAADGLDDWVVLHGGATAAFRVGSMGDAARPAQATAEVPEFADVGAVLTIAGSRLTVRITRDMWQLEAHHADLARAITAVARSATAPPEQETVQEVQLAIAARPDEADLGFWRAVLGYAPMAPDNGVDPLGHSSPVWTQGRAAAAPLREPIEVARWGA